MMAAGRIYRDISSGRGRVIIPLSPTDADAEKDRQMKTQTLCHELAS